MIPHKCPCCDGTGLVSRPPHIAGDVFLWSDSGTAPYPCKACSGTGLVWESTPAAVVCSGCGSPWIGFCYCGSATFPVYQGSATVVMRLGGES